MASQTENKRYKTGNERLAAWASHLNLVQRRRLDVAEDKPHFNWRDNST